MGAGIVTAAVVAFALFPTYGRIQQGPTKEAAELARAEGWDVVMWRLDMPSFAFYYREITPLRPPVPGEVVFTRVTRLAGLELPTEVLFQKGGVVLARALAPSGDGGARTSASPPREAEAASVPAPSGPDAGQT